MVITVVSELVVRRRKSLQTLRSNRREVTGELGVLGQHHGASCHEAVYERFLTHRVFFRPTHSRQVEEETRSDNFQQSARSALLLY